MLQILRGAGKLPIAVRALLGHGRAPTGHCGALGLIAPPVLRGNYGIWDSHGVYVAGPLFH